MPSLFSKLFPKKEAGGIVISPVPNSFKITPPIPIPRPPKRKPKTPPEIDPRKSVLYRFTLKKLNMAIEALDIQARPPMSAMQHHQKIVDTFLEVRDAIAELHLCRLSDTKNGNPDTDISDTDESLCIENPERGVWNLHKTDSTSLSED